MPKRKQQAASHASPPKPTKAKRTPPKKQTSTLANYFVASIPSSAPVAAPGSLSCPQTATTVSQNECTENSVTECPICCRSIAGLSPDKATLHINRCIDGQPDDPEHDEDLRTAAAVAGAVRFVSGTMTSTSSSSSGEQWGDDLGIVEAYTQVETSLSFKDPVAGVLNATPVASIAFELSHYEDVLDLPAWVPPQSPEDQPDTPYWKPPDPGTRICPWYKKMPGTGFTVDAFSFGRIEECTAYFLTHFHSDHYGGLSRSFDHGPLYCSAITGNLISQRLRVAETYIVRLPMERPVMVMGVKVTLIDANHCPGAVLLLFELPNGKRLLHTGDFRACPNHIMHPYLRTLPIDVCYLDTTYCAPSHRFPPQEAVISAVGTLCTRIRAGESVQSIVSGTQTNGAKVVNLLSQWIGLTKVKQQRPLVLVGSYTIGKEKMFVSVAKNLGSGIFVETTKRRVLEQLEDPALLEMLTEDPHAAVHVVKMNALKVTDLGPYISRLKLDPDIIICIRPTGWTFRPSKSSVTAVTAVEDDEAVMPSTQALATYTVTSLQPAYASIAVGGSGGGRPRMVQVVTLAVPYSEHSSFSELEAFVKGVGTTLKRVIPTVGQGESIKECCDSWLAARKAAEDVGTKCATFVGPSGY
ncbi:hypothetical protein HDU87_008004 [Geranomyces variabilis]|uniref:Metallo-beta-lactamase domain-containing protein n=1 Tax=Geranomyces variabilis TaxID=109894 RepID=A0AAD5TP24_9FUNG|nr:hypothetical protein HDU87_008004 [Geranomyces variabilis]